VGRKRGAKPRADGQEPDMRRCRPGRAGQKLRSSRGQRSGGVNPAAVRGRIVLLPGEISPHARKGGGASRGREVSRGRSSCRWAKGRTRRRVERMRSAVHCTRCPSNRNGQEQCPVKLDAGLLTAVTPGRLCTRVTASGRVSLHAHMTSTSRTARCGPHAGWCGRGAVRYPDCPLSRFWRARQNLNPRPSGS